MVGWRRFVFLRLSRCLAHSMEPGLRSGFGSMLRGRSDTPVTWSSRMSDLQQIEMFPTVGVDSGRGQDRITGL